MNSVASVSVLIVSYNTRKMTLDCIASLLAETSPSGLEVIVVDNASADGSADAIAAGFPQVQLIRSERNLGFAAANNLAAERATGELLLLLNPDTLVIDRAVDRICEFARSRRAAGVWGGRTLFGDRTLDPTSCWGRPTLWSIFCGTFGLTMIFPRSEFFNPEMYGGWNRDSVREVDIITGCWLLIERRLWERLGGFDLRYFMYGEDFDLCLRAIRAGARPVICPDATIIHFGGGSDPRAPRKLVAILRANISIIDEHLPRWQRPIARAIYRIGPLTKMICFGVAGALLRRDSAREKAAMWREVWARRREWSSGYPLPEAVRW